MLTNKKIGLWGLGIVGKSALPYLLQHTSFIQVLEAKTLSDQDQQLLAHYGIPLLEQNTDLQAFLHDNDYILASPGIDVRPHSQYAHKWITELDLLRNSFSKPLIGITGSVGKTTITSLLSQIMQQHAIPRVYTGGNIGAGMLSMLSHAVEYDAALLELSSFQLEHTKTAAPDLAIWTTFSPNHLDRHGSLAEYFDAKFQLITRQQSHQQAIVPLTVAQELVQRSCDATITIVSETPLEGTCVDYPRLAAMRYCTVRNGIITMREAGHEKPLIALNTLPTITFTHNWIIIVSALYLMHRHLGFPDYLATLPAVAPKLTLPEHRLELVIQHNGITVYNDSKATTPASTLAAVNALREHGKPIVLILGGLSKGIDRQPLIQQLQHRVQKIVCFGKEAQQLKLWCDAADIPAQNFATLDAALKETLGALQATCEPISILFSPSGSSFDLFKDYQERGTYFKQLVRELMLCK